MADETPVVFSARETEWFTPPGSPRSYLLQPLTYRERSAMRRELRRVGGIAPERAALLEGMREALRQVQPANLDACLAVVDEAEAAPEEASVQARLAVVEQAVADVPAYAALIDAQMRHNDAVPYVAARYGLRDWRGPGLPAFARVDGVVPDDLLEELPAVEIGIVGWRAYVLAMLGRSAEGNSAALSPSPESLTPTPEG